MSVLFRVIILVDTIATKAQVQKTYSRKAGDAPAGTRCVETSFTPSGRQKLDNNTAQNNSKNLESIRRDIKNCEVTINQCNQKVVKLKTTIKVKTEQNKSTANEVDLLSKG